MIDLIKSRLDRRIEIESYRHAARRTTDFVARCIGCRAVLAPPNQATITVNDSAAEDSEPGAIALVVAQSAFLKDCACTARRY
jgi:hypothetical protein